MDYNEYLLHPQLRPFVKVIYSLEGEPGAGNDAPWRILPDTCVEIVFHTEKPYLTTFADGKKVLQPHSFVMAQMRQFVEIEAAGKVGFIAVRLTAAGAHHFFPIPIGGFSGGQIHLPEIWGDLAFALEDTMHSNLGMAQKVEIVQQSLLLQLNRNGEYDPLIYHCLETIYANSGLITVGNLSKKTGISTRQLLRRFDRRVGASPKEFCRIVKFLAACRRLRSGPNDPLISVAYASDYADQAHFIHDFREYSGLTPGELLRADNVFF